ncbi:MAG: chemotaxis protein CheW [Betaproteobacteria bacterium]|nr:chemotaxis protein CheW [Betaproteobacteria bacterium]
MNPHLSQTDKAAHRYLFVSVEEHRFCLRLAEVERLLPLMQLQPVPGAPAYLLGIMNLRGEAAPVLDLALRLGIAKRTPYRLDTSVLLVRSDGKEAGLVVDDVQGVKNVPRSAVRGEGLFRDGLPPVLGVVVMDDGAALLLDTLRVLDIDLSGLSEPLALGEELLDLCRETQTA